MDWLNRSTDVLRGACTPWGIRASLTNTTNYGAVFTRDAVMSGIIGVLLQDEIIIDGFKNTLLSLKSLQGNEGQIASNFKIKHNSIDEVSFGTLSPKLDSCTWYLIGVGILLKSGHVTKQDFSESIEKVVSLLNSWEFNGKNLVYVPKGGNWADEYVYEGYILYDQLLRAWGLSLLGKLFQNESWTSKANAILETISIKYPNEKTTHFNASFYPGGEFDKFDLAAHALLGIVMQNDANIDAANQYIQSTFLNDSKLPPAFYPIINERSPEWPVLSKFHLFDFKNKPFHYHNGGIWMIWLGWLAVSFSLSNKTTALSMLVDNAFQLLDQQNDFEFDEYFSSDQLAVNGTKQLCYTAAGIALLSLAKNNFDFSILRP